MNVTTSNNIENGVIKNPFINKGFTLIYNDNLFNTKIIEKKLDQRGLLIFQKNLKNGTLVRVKNLLNQKYVIAKVSTKSNYPSFNNSVITPRVAEVIGLDVNEPYIEILELIENSHFVAKKAKTYDEEKKVADKAPIDNISISDLSTKNTSEKVSKVKISTKPNFNYIVKIGDFYFIDTAKTMINTIKNKTSLNKLKIKKMTSTKFRVYLGPFKNLKKLQTTFNALSSMNFENIEIIINDEI